MKNCPCNELAELLFPNAEETPKITKRKTTAYRIAPSPTGYVHIGTIGMATVNMFLARQSGGIFYLRIEDTDDKRFVDDSIKNMQETFDYFNIKFDEKYIQSERLAIYRYFAKKLVAEGKAYPVWGDKTGKSPLDEVKAKIEAGEPWALRADFHSKSSEPSRITFIDGAKGKISLPIETRDPIILKNNGIPTYNFAHVIDDTLMGTSVVVRGEEWLVSTSQHMQLCDLLGFPRFNYIHMPTINIDENGAKRKLSKRKDKEALAMSFIREGYPPEAIFEYLLTIYNTDFELWRIANPNSPITEFHFRTEKIGTNNPILDMPKLNDISKNIISKMDGKTTVRTFNAWFAKYGNFKLTSNEKNRVEKMLCVERGGERPRKDLVKFADIPTLYNYVLDNFSAEQGNKDILIRYAEIYNQDDDKDAWFAKLKSLAENMGFGDKKLFREFVAHIRMAITGKESSPDLWAICQVLGNDLVKKRLLLSK
jgi:glutamyl-tRNA synthetase